MKYRSNNYFSPNDSNTICDVTGFKKKKSEVVKRWDGFFVIPEAWHPQQPQDFPVDIGPQKIFDDIREEDLTTDAVPSFDKV